MMYLKFIGFWFLYIMQIIFKSVSLKDEIDRRVLNGSKAERGYFPFMGLLMQTKRLKNHVGPPDLYKRCTAILLNAYTVITAAHCFCNNKTLDHINAYIITYHVAFGLVDSNNITDSYSVAKLENVTIHPSYMSSNCYGNFTTNSNTMDVALLKLKTPMRFNENVNGIQLSSKAYQVNTKIIHAAFGRNSKYDDGILMFGASYIKKIERNWYISYVECPLYKSKCANGDSGGAMLVEDVNGMPILGGLIRGSNKGRSVYTASDKIYSWANSYGIQYNEPKTIAGDTRHQRTFSELYEYALKNCPNYAGDEC